MAKNDVAKQKVIQKIKEVYGNDFVGVFDKKAYVWSEEDGQKVQVAITLTCPKVPVGDAAPASSSDLEISFGDLDFTDNATIKVPQPQTEISADEQKNIAELLAKLGL